MTGRRLLIEQKLIGLNGAGFQELGDAYLSLRTNDIVHYGRPGSQLGKQKTVKGTPDAYMRHTDGSLSVIEHTTTTDGLVKKLKADMDKCLDPAITKVPVKDITRVILCYNSRLTLAQDADLKDYAYKKKVRLELIDLDALATDICFNYLHIAKDLLGIPVSTGQILPLQNFISEYNSKGGSLATPLDNLFLHRTNELAEMTNALSSCDLVILSGQAGVGKTKLSLQALEQFVVKNADYTPYAISNKSGYILDDLRIELIHDKNYVILVDDANRQLENFRPILGMFREGRLGRIKLLLTVRDYAKEDLNREFADYDQKQIELNKFTDDEIKALLESDSFEIRHGKYQDKIIEIADGNARLAIMAAKLAKEKQVRFLYGDVCELYDVYFQSFITDDTTLKNNAVFKTLGLFSFFYSLNLRDKAFIHRILADFDLSEADFIDAIVKLEAMELLEKRNDLVKISEQVMATYFFYRVFLKDELLSFKTLMFNYYCKDWRGRFKEAVISSNNLFFFTKQEIVQKIEIVLGQYLDSVINDHEKVLGFASLFWFYKQQELLAYFKGRINSLHAPTDPVYLTKEEKTGYKPKDEMLHQIAEVYNYDVEALSTALMLGFEYCRKKPELFPELLKYLEERMVFDARDEETKFVRQTVLLDLLIIKMKAGDEIYRLAFFALCNHFLAHDYRGSRSGRGLTIIMTTYKLTLTDEIKTFRNKIWQTLFEMYANYPGEVFIVIRDHHAGIDSNLQITKFDLELLYPFLQENLDATNFEHVYFVQGSHSWMSRKSKTSLKYNALKEKFTSPVYDCYNKLEFKRDRKAHERGLRKNFVFKSEADFAIVQQAVKEGLALKHHESLSLSNALDIIAEENFKRNPELGLKFLNSTFLNYPNNLNPMRLCVSAIVQSGDDHALTLWNLINCWNHSFAVHWKLEFFNFLPDHLYDRFYSERLLETIESINGYAYLQFPIYDKFSAVDPEILAKILRIAVDKFDAESRPINLPFHFFEEFSERLRDHFDLLTKAYFQYQQIKNNMDSQRKGLRALVMINPSFLITYLETANEDDKYDCDNDRHHFGFVWDLNNHSLVEQAINLVVARSRHSGILEHVINMFFNDLDETRRAQAHAFIKGYIEKYNTDKDKMNAIFDVLRHRMSQSFNEAYHHFLSFNKDVEFYKTIKWRGSGGGMMKHGTLFGEIEARDWKRILELTERSPDQFELIEITAHLKREINDGLRFAEQERNNYFADPHF